MPFKNEHYEKVYQAYIYDLVLGKIGPTALSRQFNIPIGTIGAWKHAFIKDNGGKLMAHSLAEKLSKGVSENVIASGTLGFRVLIERLEFLKSGLPPAHLMVEAPPSIIELNSRLEVLIRGYIEERILKLEESKEIQSEKREVDILEINQLGSALMLCSQTKKKLKQGTEEESLLEEIRAIILTL